MVSLLGRRNGRHRLVERMAPNQIMVVGGGSQRASGGEREHTLVAHEGGEGANKE